MPTFLLRKTTFLNPLEFWIFSRFERQATKTNPETTKTNPETVKPNSAPRSATLPVTVWASELWSWASVLRSLVLKTRNLVSKVRNLAALVVQNAYFLNFWSAKGSPLQIGILEPESTFLQSKLDNKKALPILLPKGGPDPIKFPKPKTKTTKPNPEITKPNPKTAKPNPAARNAALPVT